VIFIIGLILFFTNKEVESCKLYLKSQQIPIEIKQTTKSLSFPERNYTPRMPRTGSSDNIGYIYNQSDIYPLYLYRVDRNYYYHVIDKSRNNVKIPIENNKNQEFYEGDVINIPELNGEYTIKLYDYSGNIYNPYL
jgi:hypothetical protein